jgi:hypothetical protein
MHKSAHLTKVRQPFQQMVLQHSLPAIKLQPPYVTCCVVPFISIILTYTLTVQDETHKEGIASFS